MREYLDYGKVGRPTLNVGDGILWRKGAEQDIHLCILSLDVCDQLQPPLNVYLPCQDLHLQNCRGSMADPSHVLLSPDCSEAARHVDTKNDTAPPSKGRERRRIEVQEVFVFHTLKAPR